MCERERDKKVGEEESNAICERKISAAKVLPVCETCRKHNKSLSKWSEVLGRTRLLECLSNSHVAKCNLRKDFV